MDDHNAASAAQMACPACEGNVVDLDDDEEEEKQIRFPVRGIPWGYLQFTSDAIPGGVDQ